MVLQETYGCVLLSACALLAVLYVLCRRHPSSGSSPGVPSLPLVGCLPFILLNKHRLYEWTCEVFDRSASLTIRLTMGSSVFFSTIDPQCIEHILKSKFSSYPKGPSFYPYFDELLGRGIFNCDGSLWRFQRKVASHVFTSASLRDFVVDVADTEISNRLLPVLDAAQRSSESVVDLQALLMDCTFDTTCQLTFGADPACLEKNKEKGVPDKTVLCHVPDFVLEGFVQGFQIALQITAERFLVPQFWWRTKKYFKIGSEKRLIESLEAVNKFTTYVIEQSKSKREIGKDRRDLLARFLRLSDALNVAAEGTFVDSNACTVEQEGTSISDSLLRDILLSFILAGRDTVASGATFALWLLCVHPRVETEVLKEIREILKDRQTSAGNTKKIGTFTYEEVKRMNYLHAVLSEALRLYPPVPSDCKFADEDDVLPNGTRVAKGSRISYNVFAMGRAARVWGNDCLEFRPERWLDENGLFKPVNPFKYPVFQAGPRTCLGKDFAFIEMKLLVASLIRDFQFFLQPGFTPKLSYGVSMLMVNGLPLTVKRRSESTTTFS
ncbi:hypothetical protein KP509_29G029800 [Ceratopteris richardii]|uniref:Cytochrome P450 n=1 Tax=Ceratopteris richardii TaxID=49495 RepID=A0A8T2R7G4_CERRI|nr:hypothetical protein KP509_29G029800 [Ceratopteris richardii]